MKTTVSRDCRIVIDPRASHLRTEPQKITLRPDEFRLFWRWPLWPYQFIGMATARIRRDGSGADFVGKGALAKHYAPPWIWLGYYVIGWPCRALARAWHRLMTRPGQQGRWPTTPLLSKRKRMR